MKEKIITELKAQFPTLFRVTEKVEVMGVLLTKRFDKYFSQALDEYADWKIKECLPEKAKLSGGMDENEIWREGYNACIDEILSNKDKK